MRLLQTGISGFNASREVAAADFKRAVHAAARAVSANVGHVRPAGVTPNFHEIDVDFASRALAVLCNQHVAIVAFADPVGRMEIERYLDAPAEFAAALAQCGFMTGDVAELNRRVTTDDLRMLSPAEQDHAKYWKPKRVGDIIFNWWD